MPSKCCTEGRRVFPRLHGAFKKKSNALVCIDKSTVSRKSCCNFPKIYNHAALGLGVNRLCRPPLTERGPFTEFPV